MGNDFDSSNCLEVVEEQRFERLDFPGEACRYERIRVQA